MFSNAVTIADAAVENQTHHQAVVEKTPACFLRKVNNVLHPDARLPYENLIRRLATAKDGCPYQQQFEYCRDGNAS